MKLYSYVMVHATGFAPNPYWGYCTLAACTPNHVGIKPKPGDWIIGTETKEKGNKLVYAMQVCETLGFDEYYKDPRFQKKKPVKNGSAKERCGDNLYFRSYAGEWQQYDQAVYHTEEEKRKKDLRHPYAFVAEKFYYFGRQAVSIPPEYQSLIWNRQGVNGDHTLDVVNRFLEWLCSKHQPGISGDPTIIQENTVGCGSCGE